MQDATPLPAIVLKDLEKYYPPPRTGIAFQGVTFEV
jgi:hypothetical protein